VLKILGILGILAIIGFHLIRFIYHYFSPEAKKEFLRKKTEKHINADFPRYEKECRKKHNKQAENEFSILPLKKEIDNLLSKIEREANLTFKNDIFNTISSIEKIKLQVANNQKIIDIFSKNYKETLDSLYIQKESFFLKKNNLYSDQEVLRNKLKDAFTDKDEAYKELNECKANIDSWYAESDRTPWLLGNGGNKIPDHSMFGQSFGDLDSYKYDRDKAYSNVESCKEEIGGLKSEIDHNKVSVNSSRLDARPHLL